MRGVFFGSNPRVAEIVNRTIRLTSVVIETKSFSKEIFDFANFVSARFICIDAIDEFRDSAGLAEIAIACGFGLIFTKDCIRNFPNGILNIHYGDLPNYRSRHPVSWAMICGEERIGVTIHKVDEQIDCGYLVHKFFIDRSFTDDLPAIENKIENSLSTEFPRAIEQFMRGNLATLGSGKYFQRIDHSFSEVDPAKMVSKELFSLFMSQRCYGGVNILGKKKKECHAFNPRFRNYYEGYEIFRCADGALIAVK